jgi:hypothetical protein
MFTVLSNKVLYKFTGLFITIAFLSISVSSALAVYRSGSSIFIAFYNAQGPHYAVGFAGSYGQVGSAYFNGGANCPQYTSYPTNNWWGPSLSSMLVSKSWLSLPCAWNNLTNAPKWQAWRHNANLAGW